MKMNKKLLASLVAVGILSTGTAFAAANPFDDVPKDHWSYDAVQTLADDGIVDGYGDNTYRGDKLMTRYEMAQIVGRAVSQSKKADASQKATIDKLAAEYSAELDSLGVRVGNVEKKTAGVQDLKISHWIQTENTYGDNTAVENDKKHEYELEYRLQVEKQISPKLAALMQIETQTYWDDDHWRAERQDDGVYTRLAYLTYKPDSQTTIIGGKNAYWLAGGFLGDDFVSGININRKLNDTTNLQIMHGYYNGSQRAKAIDGAMHSQISYLGVDTKLGVVDFGVHYLTGQKSFNNVVDPSKIWAVTAATDLGKSGVNLSLGYGKNTEASEANQMMKVQLYKKIGKTDTFLQYWKQQGNVDLPMENGNHLTWWEDEYNKDGHDGFRLILGHSISANCYAEAWYGNYKNLATSEKGNKYGWALTFSY